MNCLVVHCHPDPASFNAALYRVACDALREAGHELRCFDLYAEGFDPVLTREERQAYLPNPALIEARVQPHVDALRWAEHLVFVYPTWFYGPPAVLKGWLERVWLPGVAFLPPPRKGARAVPGLRHVRRLTVVTTSGSPWWWLRVMGDPGKRLFTRGLRALFAPGCKVTWLQQHDMNNATRADLEGFLARVSRTLGAMAT
jgi:putative NADPH-quinone reductase